VLDAAQQQQSGGREQASLLHARVCLQVLQGAFQSMWAVPAELSAALAELSTTQGHREGGKGELRALVLYVEALSPYLSKLCGVGGGEGMPGAQARKGRSKHKRRRRGSGGGKGHDGGDASEVRVNASSGISDGMWIWNRGVYEGLQCVYQS
jgi:hypothetical protein